MMTGNYKLFFHNAPDPFCILDTNAVFLQINRSFTRILGWSKKEIKETSFLNYVHPVSIEKTKDTLEMLSQRDALASLEIRFRCKDSTYRIVRWSFSSKDRILFGSGNDVSELRETYDLFKLLIENSPTGMILVNQKGVIQIANHEAARIFGYPEKDELIDHPVEILLPDKIKSKHTKIRKKFSIDPQTRPMGRGRDLLGRQKNGHQIEVEVGLNPIKTEQGTFVLSTIIDLTQRKQSEETMIRFTEQLEESIQELSLLASTDSLTQLKNRRAFTKHFNLSLQNTAKKLDQISLLLLDIDDFKSYNDTFGHPAGDNLLIEIAQLLQSLSRTHDFIARIGGEEFAVILPGTRRDSSVKIAKRYLRAFETKKWPRRQVTASIGVASYSFMGNHTEDIENISGKLFLEADQALYESKARGKNQVTHFEIPNEVHL